MFDVTLLSDATEGGIRRTSFRTCAAVCSEQIDIETEGDVIRSVKYTKGRGTSCPDQLARALKQL